MMNRQRICGGLAGVAIGDAVGMPVEMMSPERIQEITGGRGILEFMVPEHRRLDDGSAVMVRGSTTDDWQLTRVVAESLVACGGFCIQDIGLRHVGALEKSCCGWGRTTRSGIERLKRYYDSRGLDENPYVVDIVGSGCGNGVAMKVMPLGMMNCSLEELQKWVAGLGRMTHPDPRSWAAAYGLAWLVRHGVQEGSVGRLEELIFQTAQFEYNYCWTAGRRGPMKDQFSERLERLTGQTLNGPIENLRSIVGTGCLALESVTFAIACFYRNAGDFSSGILEAANSGGDADSTASMCGGLIGTHVGLDGIEKRWLEGCSSAVEAAALGNRLADSIESSGRNL